MRVLRDFLVYIKITKQIRLLMELVLLLLLENATLLIS